MYVNGLSMFCGLVIMSLVNNPSNKILVVTALARKFPSDYLRKASNNARSGYLTTHAF